MEVAARTFKNVVSFDNKLQLFFRILQWCCLISNHNQTMTLQRHMSDIQLLGNKSLLCSILSSHKFGHGVFLHLHNDLTDNKNMRRLRKLFLLNILVKIS